VIYTPVAEIYRRFKQRQQLIDWYEPLNKLQAEALYSTHPVQLIEGGNRSGKTDCLVVKFVMISTDRHPTIKREHPLKFRMIATVMREGALGILVNKFKRWMPSVHLKGGSWDKAFSSFDNILYCRNGDTFQFMSDNQDIQTHRGDDMDFIGCDEEIKEEVFDESLTRLADRNGILVMSMTPHDGMTWSYKKLVKASRRDPQIGYFHLDTLGNYKINREEWVKRSAILSDKEFNIRVKGVRMVNEGLVYYMVQDKTHLIRPFELPPDTHLFLGVDFGINNPHAGSLWAITPEGKKYIVDEYYETGKTVSQNGEAQGKWIAGRWGKYKLRWIACDPRSGAQRNEQTSEMNINVFKKAFLSTYQRNVPVVPGDAHKGCVEHRINILRELLTPRPNGLPELMIFSTCINTMNEFEVYSWNVRKQEDMNLFERPKDAFNHLMNAAEYVAERNPRNLQNVYKNREIPVYELQYGSVGR
jgi:phage terminase large subunit-like protein